MNDTRYQRDHYYHVRKEVIWKRKKSITFLTPLQSFNDVPFNIRVLRCLSLTASDTWSFVRHRKKCIYFNTSKAPPANTWFQHNLTIFFQIMFICWKVEFNKNWLMILIPDSTYHLFLITLESLKTCPFKLEAADRSRILMYHWIWTNLLIIELYIIKCIPCIKVKQIFFMCSQTPPPPQSW